MFLKELVQSSRHTKLQLMPCYETQLNTICSAALAVGMMQVRIWLRKHATDTFIEKYS
jgi:hypothetical protein